jgi:alpha-glucoside transport system substrate-binding protein
MQRSSKGFLVGIVCLLLVLGAGLIQAQDESPSVSAARARALEIVGGQPIGGTVSMLGVLGGAELESFLSIIRPFEEATGITVEYESTRDIAAVLQTRVEGGNPPDIVSNPGVGQMMSLAEAGEMIPLSQVMDIEDLQSNYDAVLLDSISVNGELYTIFTAVNLGGLVWYNPNQYDGPNPPASWDELADWATETAANGTAPWCIGMESGAASGWPGGYWITEFFMRENDADTYNAWWQGELPWTSPEVRRAFEQFGEIATDPALVMGGSTAALATSFVNGGDGVFTDPPTCYLHQQASFYGGIANGNFPDLTPIEDINFFLFPDLSADYPNVAEVSGEVMGMFNDTPQARAFIEYFASTEAQTLLVETGSYLSPNRNIALDAYPSPFTQRAAEVLSSADTVYYTGFGLMPQAIVDAFLGGILRYVQDPSQLDTILSDIEAVRQQTYAS